MDSFILFFINYLIEEEKQKFVSAMLLIMLFPSSFFFKIDKNKKVHYLV